MRRPEVIPSGFGYIVVYPLALDVSPLDRFFRVVLFQSFAFDSLILLDPAVFFSVPRRVALVVEDPLPKMERRRTPGDGPMLRDWTAVYPVLVFARLHRACLIRTVHCQLAEDPFPGVGVTRCR